MSNETAIYIARGIVALGFFAATVGFGLVAVAYFFGG